MSRLNATVRNNRLRISLSREQIRRKNLHEMQSEFLKYLKQAHSSDVVIVDLPGIQKLESEMVGLLQNWNRIAAMSGRTFRLNGVSRVLHDFQQQVHRPHSRPVTPVATL